MTCLMSDAPYAAWLMDALKLLEEEHVGKITVAGISPKGEVVTGYFGMEMSDKATLSAHIQADAVMDMVCANGSLIRDRWDEDTEADNFTE